ncbi:uncharacterized protein LOC136085693 [Hydra vulgaris]|uniref:Uncharacterized protein LOC136085693 n=1 Tax=Hydra vulgaris TaxID=6087 RepID=A0ABM4CMM8_HYDVU
MPRKADPVKKLFLKTLGKTTNSYSCKYCGKGYSKNTHNLFVHVHKCNKIPEELRNAVVKEKIAEKNKPLKTLSKTPSRKGIMRSSSESINAATIDITELEEFSSSPVQSVYCPKNQMSMSMKCLLRWNKNKMLSNMTFLELFLHPGTL